MKKRKSISSPVYRMFRSFLVEARQEAGLSQAKLAKRLGRHQSYVAKYEIGEKRLDVLEFITVSKHIGIDPVRLLRKLLKKTE